MLQWTRRGIAATKKLSELGFLGLKDDRIFCLELGFSQDLQDYQDFLSILLNLENLNKILVQDNPKIL